MQWVSTRATSSDEDGERMPQPHDGLFDEIDAAESSSQRGIEVESLEFDSPGDGVIFYAVYYLYRRSIQLGGTTRQGAEQVTKTRCTRGH
jgi:hypothetical protein